MLGGMLGKFHLEVEKRKTEISADSEDTRLCLGCFKPLCSSLSELSELSATVIDYNPYEQSQLLTLAFSLN